MRVGAGDAGQAVNKAVLTKDNPQGDVFFGVDNTLLSRALDNGLFQPYEAEGSDLILDEYRVVSDKGDETWYVTTTLRNYNAHLDRWELVGADAGTGLMDMGTARKEGAEMHIEQTFGVASGNTSTWRIRYYDIQKDRFSWEADRSTDGGKTWVKRHQTIEARRIGPPRSLPALAPPRP